MTDFSRDGGDERGLRELIVEIGRLLHHNQMVDGVAGNISARLDGERILMTPSGLAKGFMHPDEMIIVDMAGEKTGPQTPRARDLRPTSEVLMHLEAYRQRPDIGGVVHAHPPAAVALSIANIPLERYPIPEQIIHLGIVPTTPYALPASAEMQESISEVVRHHNAMILRNHGVLVLGSDAWEAYLMTETVERTAQVILMVEQLGGGEPLPPDEVDRLLELRRQMGKSLPGEEERLQAKS
jgi:L-fuculose-phosphate aldolase